MSDILQRFIFANFPVSGCIVRLDSSIKKIVSQHDYPDNISMLLSEALAANLLMASTIKWQGYLILQYQATSGVKLLVAKSNHLREVSAMAEWDESLPKDPLHLLAGGQLVVSVLQDNKKDPYQSLIALKQQALEDSIQEYFIQSEQIETRITLLGSPDFSCGLILQKLPDADFDFDSFVSVLDNGIINYSVSNGELIEQLFGPDQVSFSKEEPVVFKCQCSLDKMRQALITVGEKSIREELAVKSHLVVHCDFCGMEYSFSLQEIDDLFS